MYYTIYKITNLLNDKIYIGAHETQDLDDGYMGSGKNIIAAIKKYGDKNFSKEILMLFDSREEMYYAEKLIINEDFLKTGNIYNIVLGGGAPPNPSGQKRSEKAKENYKKAFSKRDKNYAKRIAKIRKENGSYETQRLVARKIGKANKGRVKTAEEINMIKNRSMNSRWYTNGSIDKFIHINSKIPKGFYLGRSKAKIRKRK